MINYGPSKREAHIQTLCLPRPGISALHLLKRENAGRTHSALAPASLSGGGVAPRASYAADRGRAAELAARTPGKAGSAPEGRSDQASSGLFHGILSADCTSGRSFLLFLSCRVERGVLNLQVLLQRTILHRFRQLPSVEQRKVHVRGLRAAVRLVGPPHHVEANHRPHLVVADHEAIPIRGRLREVVEHPVHRDQLLASGRRCPQSESEYTADHPRVKRLCSPSSAAEPL